MAYIGYDSRFRPKTRTLPRPEGRWLWEVAPFGEEAPDARRIHTVVAYPDLHLVL